MELATAMEAADTSTKTFKATEASSISKLAIAAKPQSPQSLPACHRCGKRNHVSKNCRFKNERCHRCGKIGHIAPVCRSAKGNTRDTGKHLKQRGRDFSSRKQHIHQVKHDNSDSDTELPLNQIYILGERPFTDALKVNVMINGVSVSMEVDTGAAVSIISQAQQRTLLPDVTLHASPVHLKTYTGERMNVVGETMVSVSHNHQQESLPLIVVAEDGPPLFGRTWLRRIQLDWKTIGSLRMSPHKSVEHRLQDLLTRYSDVFRDELGTIQSMKVKLHLQPNATPRFFKPRSVPFALKPAIEEELVRLESSGIVQRVSTSDWAAPIVPVPKKDGSMRLCGDYKVTINPVLNIEQYPLPKPQELFATLAGGQKFTKLDLQQAYLQLQLEEESRKYVTVNTHRGLFEYIRLPFGMASAPALFQKTMDTILQDLPGVKCYLDDLLITGATDDQHLKNLESVLRRLQSEGMRLKKSKCSFLQPSVEYLGHRVDATGLHPSEHKLQAVVDAPRPKNVKELQSFLGLIHYYGSFISNLSTLLHPLNSLLQKDSRWRWSTDCEEAFKAAKKRLTTSSVLVHYDPTLPIRVSADASSHGLGAVISHVMPDNQEHPIAFASRTLTSSEKNYAQVEKEALALIFAVKKFHQYLYGRCFSLCTDHKPLLSILGPKKNIPSLAAARLQRWAILLSACTYTCIPLCTSLLRIMGMRMLYHDYLYQIQTLLYPLLFLLSSTLDRLKLYLLPVIK